MNDTGDFSGDYSEIADAQLNALEAGPDPGLYNAVLDACELILRFPGQAHALSSAIRTDAGIRLRLPVTGYPPYKVFWSTAGPRLEATFPHRCR
ncbi:MULTISPECIES: hypothetical protein [Mycobacterium]|uniref:hypothetical protein n=1 Tax=Mycobacterium TaxID=1763 RepID=UPI0005F06E53|nr:MULTISPECIES: hypothetical protein [Mycobacterium]MDA3642008.1 hypothetical protein [Mycobacterium xenopi]MDA3660226.1 hypothetical protein [Mycobacterium xenopi]MDA3664365.1 hypothetical protein [Mycobacterium xenopi]SPX88505.1 Uncharacterised protein [Mycobacterium xenopi]